MAILSFEAMKEPSRVLFAAVGLSFVTKAVNLLLSFLTIPLAIHYLGAERYGLWVLAVSSFGVMGNLDLGMVPTAKNKMAEAWARNDRREFRRLQGSAIYLALVYLGIAIIAAGVGTMIDWPVVFNSAPSIDSDEVNAMSIVILFGVTSCSSITFIESICAAQLRLRLIRLIQLASTLLGFSLLIIALYAGGSLPWVAAGTHVACLLGGGFLFSVITRGEPLLRHATLVDFVKTVRHLLPSSLPFAGIQLTNAAFAALPSFIIAHTMTQADVATFAVGYKFVTVPLLMIGEIGFVFWPLSTVSWNRGETTWLRKQLARLVVGVIVLMTLFSLVSIFFGEEMISLWVSGRVHVSTELLSALTLWLVVQSVVTLLSSFLRSVGDFRFELFVNTMGLAIFLVVALFLVRMYGLTGIATALFISSLFASLFPIAHRVRMKLSER
jgi:O-antigen/teichoic acid export membrane protein